MSRFTIEHDVPGADSDDVRISKDGNSLFAGCPGCGAEVEVPYLNQRVRHASCSYFTVVEVQ